MVSRTIVSVLIGCIYVATVLESASASTLERQRREEPIAAANAAPGGAIAVEPAPVAAADAAPGGAIAVEPAPVAAADAAPGGSAAVEPAAPPAAR